MQKQITNKDLECLGKHLIGMQTILASYGLGLGNDGLNKKVAKPKANHKTRVEKYSGRI